MKSRFGLAILVVLIALAVAPTTATAQTFDNSGGGSWKEYMSFLLTSPITEYAQYKIVINGTTWVIYNVTGSLEEASGTNNNFWSLVNSSGADIRVFNQNEEQRYFWIEEFDYSNQKAIMWVKVETGDTELNIAYGNPSATKSIYENPERVFEFFDDFSTFMTPDVFVRSTGVAFPFHHNNRPVAVYVPEVNKIYIAYQYDAGNLNAGRKILEYDCNTKTFSAPIDIGGSMLNDDSHGAPSIAVDNDGYIWVFYGSHSSTQYYKRSLNPYDISSWSEEKSISGSFTYPQLWVDQDGNIWVIARTGDGTTYDIYKYDPSTDSFTYVQRLLNLSNDPYGISYYYNGTVYFVFTACGETCEGLYIIKSNDFMNWTKMDGTPVSLPITDPTQADVIDSGDCRPHGGDIKVIDGKVHVVYDKVGEGQFIAIYNPDTNTWSIHKVANYTTYSAFPKLIKTSDGKLKVFLIYNRTSSDNGELWCYVSEDGGATWTLESKLVDVPNVGQIMTVYYPNKDYVDTGEIALLFAGNANDTRCLSALMLPDNIVTIDKWSTNDLDSSSDINVSNGILTYYRGSTTFSSIKTLKTFAPNVILHAKVYYDTNYGYPAEFGFADTQKTEPDNSAMATRGLDRIQAYASSGGSYGASSEYIPLSTGWKKFMVKWTDNEVVVTDGVNTVSVTNNIPTIELPLRLGNFQGGGTASVYLQYDYVFVTKLADPTDFGTPIVKSLQKQFGTKTVYVNITYLDTAVTERYNPTAYYNLEDKPQINVTSMLSVSGVNATDGANISIELIDFVTLDKIVYNGTEVSVTYQGTITNATTGYVYDVYNFTTYENGTLEIYGHIGNKAYEATFKLDGETVDVFNVTAVVGEALEITLPHRGNVTLASIEYIGVTSVFINTKDLGTGAKSLTITIEDPENFTVGYKYGTVNIDWGKVYFNVTDLQNKTLARTTYGFFNKNFSIVSTDPMKLYAGDIEIDVYFHGVKLKSLEIYLNHTNNGLTLNVSVNATQFKDYRNVTRIIASPNYFEVVNLSTKYPFSVMKLVNVSGTIVIDFVSNAPTSVKVEGATSYTYEKPVLKITADGNVTVIDLYKLTAKLKDRLSNPVNFYVLINGSRVDASNGIASKLLKPSWYEVEVPISISGFELWKFNDSSNIVLVEINASDKTIPTAEYRVPSKIETKEVRIQKTKFPWLPFPIPFLSESKPAQEETPIVRLQGSLRDFYNAPVANRTIKIEVASPNFTRIYNVTTDESGNFKIEVDMAKGVEYKVTYKFAGDDVYVATSTTKTFTIEQLLPAPPEEMTIEEILIFVGIAVGLVAVVAGAIYLAKRTKAKTLARMESEFRFFRRLK